MLKVVFHTANHQFAQYCLLQLLSLLKIISAIVPDKILIFVSQISTGNLDGLREDLIFEVNLHIMQKRFV